MMCSKRSAITLVEVLVVLAIIAIVAGLTYPSVRRASEGAKVSASLLRGKQIHMALMLYREDSGGETGAYGEPSIMNLPTDSYSLFWDKLYGLDEGMLRSPCGRLDASGLIMDIYPTPIEGTIWAPNAKKYEESTPVVMDFHCNPPNPYLGSHRVTKRAIVTALSGTSYIKRSKGHASEWKHWVTQD